MIFRVNNEYFLNNRNDTRLLNIQGEITGIYSRGHNYFVITSDINTYFMYDRDSKLFELNCICEKNGVDISTKSCVLKTIDGQKRLLIYGDKNIDPILLNDPVIGNHSVTKFKKYNIYTNSYNNSFKIENTIIVDDIHITNIENDNKVIISNNDILIRYSYDKIIPIKNDFVCKKMFVVDNVNSLDKNMYILDTYNNVWILKDFSKFTQLFSITDANQADNIRHIVANCDNNYYACIGKYFFNLYCNHKLIYSSDLNDCSNDYEYVTNIWINSIIIKNNIKGEYIIIGSSYLRNIIIINSNILITELTRNVYILKPLNGVKIVFYGSYFYIEYNNLIYYSTSSDDECIETLRNDAFNYCRKYLLTRTTYFDCNVNYFNIFYNTLIACNFSLGFEINICDKISRKAYGIGVSYDVYTSIMEDIKNDLFDESFSLNLKNPFWSNENNCFYFGKMLVYFVEVKRYMNFHICLSNLIIIYQTLLKLKSNSSSNSNLFNIDELAPFHKIINLIEYNSIKLMDDSYKTNKFNELMLSYDSFDDMIYDLLNIRKPSEQELKCLQLIAEGMYDFNNSITKFNMYLLSVILGGNYIYDRINIMNKISFYEEDANYKKKFIVFLNSLNDHEFKRFMITSTGHTNVAKNSSLHVHIKTYSSTVNIKIETCNTKILINTSLINQENYLELLKAYFCTKDSYIQDLKIFDIFI
jgi:hypothetical protein